MDVLGDGGDEHLVAGVRVNAAIDAGHDVDARTVDVGVTVEVAIGAELLDDIDVDREALAATSAKKVTIGVRPEDVTVSTTGEGLPVDVDVVEELGADGYLYGHTDIDGSRVDIVARVDGRIHPNAGDKVFITPVAKHVHAFDVESGERLSKAVTD